ncbi:MAG: NAD-dependent epimerase/dehydratase family protein, partial [Gammaproteobacteria bacterium]|nr:NAD-dependent epimerase/dehydratase family protein [Gammaproteobacteria bacterium]
MSLVRMLVEQADRVIVFDSYGTTPLAETENPKIKFVEGNLLNEKDLYLLFRQYEFDAVYHLATRSTYTTEKLNTAMCYRNNVTGTMNLLTHMHRHNITNIVFTSTAEVYGHHNGRDINETQPTNPLTGFASTITTVEQIMGFLHEENGLNSVSLRLQNACGVDENSIKASRNENRQSDLVDILEACRSGDNLAYKTPKAEQAGKLGTTRGYLHVLDVCNAHIKAMEFLYQNNPGAHKYNLADGRGYSTRDLIEIAEDITGRRVNSTTTTRENCPSVQTLSGERLMQDMDWVPKYS